jgi:hypothetical protein
MPMVFLSHAAADKALVDDLKTMLQQGIGVGPTEFFYSSDKGSGIPAGSNFVDYIRGQMQGSTFVVAVITPVYLESEFCLAELGAVWASADKDFFPLCVPRVSRADLKATLTGIQVERIDERGPLAELLQRLCAHFDRVYVAAACDTAIGVFLATLGEKLDALQGSTKVPAERLEEANKTTQALAEQLNASREEVESERGRYAALEAAKTKEEIEALDLPEDEIEQIKHLLKEARSAVGPLKSSIRQVIPFRMQGRGSGMPWPSGQWERNDLQDEVDAGYLLDGEDGFVYLNTDWPDIAAAVEAASALQDAFENMTTDARQWFLREYAVPPDLQQAAAFKELV